MAPLPLTIAINDYDHVRDLLTGRVQAEGISLTALNFEVEEIFYRFVNFREWDISEMSMGKYVSLRAGGDDSVIAAGTPPSRPSSMRRRWLRRAATSRSRCTRRAGAGCAPSRVATCASTTSRSWTTTSTRTPTRWPARTP